MENDDFVVVMNHEDQYAIWAADKPVPAGWRLEGMRGTKVACMEHVDKCWTDMRPASLRRAMGA